MLRRMGTVIPAASIVIAALIFLSAMTSGQSVPTACVSPVGTFDSGVWWRWTIDDSVLTNAGGVPALKCKYDAELAGAPYAGACVGVFTDPSANVWLLTVEKLNADGQLVCRYAWQGTAPTSGPELSAFRTVR